MGQGAWFRIMAGLMINAILLGYNLVSNGFVTTHTPWLKKSRYLIMNGIHTYLGLFAGCLI